MLPLTPVPWHPCILSYVLPGTAGNVVSLDKQAGGTLTHKEIQDSLQQHKPAVLFLCQAWISHLASPRYGKYLIVQNLHCPSQYHCYLDMLGAFPSG